jgi:MoaA/NifB/PqqE/SkfB family radical SAM enzyme
MIDELHGMGMRWLFVLGGEPLLHPDIGQVIRYATNKNIFLQVLTNGTLIEDKIDDIEPAAGICVSLDGDESVTDAMRGAGTFRRALKGIEVARSRDIPVRMHAVLTRNNINAIKPLALMARDLKAMLTVSPPNYLGTTDNPDLQLSRDEYQRFYAQYRQLKKEGFPIGNSYYAINKVIEWPGDYHTYIGSNDTFTDYQPVPCSYGRFHACIDGEGRMFTCIQRGCENGINIRHKGIRAAWDALPAVRSDCLSCASLNTIEASTYLSLRPEIIYDALRFFVR